VRDDELIDHVAARVLRQLAGGAEHADLRSDSSV